MSDTMELYHAEKFMAQVTFQRQKSVIIATIFSDACQDSTLNRVNPCLHPRNFERNVLSRIYNLPVFRTIVDKLVVIH